MQFYSFIISFVIRLLITSQQYSTVRIVKNPSHTANMVTIKIFLGTFFKYFTGMSHKKNNPALAIIQGQINSFLSGLILLRAFLFLAAIALKSVFLYIRGDDNTLINFCLSYLFNLKAKNKKKEHSNQPHRTNMPIILVMVSCISRSWGRALTWGKTPEKTYGAG